ncbi:MAG: hypothetical protein ACRD1O_13015 [Terriglobia bacterium]
MKALGTFPSIVVSILAFLLAFGLTARPALAQITVTTNAIGGNWTTPATWACFLPPCVANNNSSEVFNVGIYGGTVTLDNSSSLTSVSINSLSFNGGGTLSIEDSEMLNVTNDLTNFRGILSVDSGGSGGSSRR